ncbi:MAG: DNA/RNA helicase domain-containing protein, partial [Bacteroidota bacterium]
AKGYAGERGGVHIAGPDAIDALIANFADARDRPPLSADAFLQADAYRPLPTLVQAARELFTTGTLRDIWRARANTDPAVNQIETIVRGAADAKRRRLILLTGVPGAGKTLVGLRLAHAHYLDDLAVVREGGQKPTAPAVFLSGNGPLVQVLQYQMKKAGGDGKAFVRDVKGYVKTYSSRRSAVPPEHVLIFDEAQRSWDAEMVAAKGHTDSNLSEAELFVQFAERIPEWCTIVGLIGTGQEIHLGEEGGLELWRKAVEGSGSPADWEVHGPPQLTDLFRDSAVPFVPSPQLTLDAEIRFHLAKDVHPFVDALLRGDADVARQHVAHLAGHDFHLRMTRSLDVAKAYLRERYAEHKLARFGLVASSRDRDLIHFGVRN